MNECSTCLYNKVIDNAESPCVLQVSECIRIKHGNLHIYVLHDDVCDHYTSNYRE